MSKTGSFVFSLDFELYWGVHHNRPFDTYKDNLLVAARNLPLVAKLFAEHDASLTCATVGMLYTQNWNELKNAQPAVKPTYHNSALSPYGKMPDMQATLPPQVLFAPQILAELRQGGHEIATHTYSHFFCLEPGANLEAFEDDLKKAREVAAAQGDNIVSIVFPRNQFATPHLEICKRQGICVYRGNPSSGLFDKKSNSLSDLAKRIIRLADSYLNLTGHNCYELVKDHSGMLNVKASFFLRSPRSMKLPLLQYLHMHRLKKAMSYAAEKGLVFHLWCHPHNIAAATDIDQLKEILAHYRVLKHTYGFESKTMSECLEYT
ncbi:MAG: polysaccharide deacetylase family protein [Bacteroidota bacterium]